MKRIMINISLSFCLISTLNSCFDTVADPGTEAAIMITALTYTDANMNEFLRFTFFHMSYNDEHYWDIKINITDPAGNTLLREISELRSGEHHSMEGFPKAVGYWKFEMNGKFMENGYKTNSPWELSSSVYVND